MPSAPLHPQELERLNALLEYDILDTAPEATFDCITRMASELLNVPIALVSLVDRDRQWFKSCVGLDVRQTDRDLAFCGYAILQDEPLIVPDATLDPRFSDNPLVVGPPYIRFYVGIPLKGGRGFNLGTLCVIAPHPKQLSEKELNVLLEFSALITNELALKLALKRLRDNHVQILHSEKMASIGQLAAGIAHESKTPIHFLGGTAEFLQQGFTGLRTVLDGYRRLHSSATSQEGLHHECAEVVELSQIHDVEYLLEEVPFALEQTRDGIMRVSELVSAMKVFSHPSGGEKKPEDLNAAIRATSVVARNEWKHCSALELELAQDLPLVHCRLGEMNQVVINMLTNSAHAVADLVSSGRLEWGMIRIRTYQKNDEVIIDIEDNGAGIPAAVISKIYDPFFTTKPVGKGTGQGLAIVYDIVVRKHGGRLSVDSSPGKGACFSVILPIQAHAQTANHAIPAV